MCRMNCGSCWGRGCRRGRGGFGIRVVSGYSAWAGSCSAQASPGSNELRGVRGKPRPDDRRGSDHDRPSVGRPADAAASGSWSLAAALSR